MLYEKDRSASNKTDSQSEMEKEEKVISHKSFRSSSSVPSSNGSVSVPYYAGEKKQQTNNTVKRLIIFVIKMSPFISRILLFKGVCVHIVMGGGYLYDHELTDPMTGWISQVIRLQLPMLRSSPVITLQSSLSLFRFEAIIYAVPGRRGDGVGYNPLGQFQVTYEPGKDVFDKVCIKGETSPPASF